MNTTIGCPIPGESQPKEPVRLIDIKEILQYDGAHFTWSGGRNCLTEQKAAYARGYDAGMKFIVDEAKKAPIIDPESLRPTEEWISVKDRLPDPDEKVIVYNAENDSTFFARRIESCFKCWDAVTREFVNWRWIPYGYTCITLDSVTHWMLHPKPPKEAHNE